jgi:hypothetical protein
VAGHVRATVAVGRRRWAWEQAVRRLGCENGEFKWSTRCARMRRPYWCSLRGRRRLGSGNGERRSCGGGGGENREEENAFPERIVFVGSGRGYSAGMLALAVEGAPGSWPKATAALQRPYRAVVGGDWPAL